MARETTFFEGSSWFKLSNLGLGLDMDLKFCTNMAKGSKLEVRKFWRLVLTFVEVTEEKLIEFLLILNRVNKENICYWGRLQINLPSLCTRIKLYYYIALVTYAYQKQEYFKQSQFSNQNIRASEKIIQNL